MERNAKITLPDEEGITLLRRTQNNAKQRKQDVLKPGMPERYKLVLERNQITKITEIIPDLLILSCFASSPHKNRSEQKHFVVRRMAF